MLAVSLALGLCGCASASRDLAAPLAVEIPATCERLLEQVPLPPVKASDDARAAFLKDDAALITANARLAAGRACLLDLRQRYAGKHAGHQIGSAP